MEISTNPATEARNHIFHQVGWLAMGFIIIAAIAGYFGFGGPASKATLHNEQFTLTYDRFARAETPSYLFLTAHKNLKNIVMLLPEKEMRVQGIVPEGALKGVVNDRKLVFELDANHSVALKIMPRRFGVFPISIDADGTTISFDSLIYP